ncbi:Uncharacterised protein [Mycobacteroides abscessus subsp. massiliense]|nr:Uncharacterised protein [Mycobacteroides abscessus subsp. massiliense]SKU82280.1 Uncharacterised protein [Mycobacteroides abscessus subsp. massiliense]
MASTLKVVVTSGNLGGNGSESFQIEQRRWAWARIKPNDLGNLLSLGAFN